MIHYKNHHGETHKRWNQMSCQGHGRLQKNIDDVNHVDPIRNMIRFVNDVAALSRGDDISIAKNLWPKQKHIAACFSLETTQECVRR